MRKNCLSVINAVTSEDRVVEVAKMGNFEWRTVYISEVTKFAIHLYYQILIAKIKSEFWLFTKHKYEDKNGKSNTVILKRKIGK